MFQIIFSSQNLAQERETISPSKIFLKQTFKTFDEFVAPLVLNKWVEYWLDI